MISFKRSTQLFRTGRTRSVRLAISRTQGFRISVLPVIEQLCIKASPSWPKKRLRSRSALASTTQVPSLSSPPDSKIDIREVLILNTLVDLTQLAWIRICSSHSRTRDHPSLTACSLRLNIDSVDLTSHITRLFSHRLRLPFTKDLRQEPQAVAIVQSSASP